MYRGRLIRMLVVIRAEDFPSGDLLGPAIGLARRELLDGDFRTTLVRQLDGSDRFIQDYLTAGFECLKTFIVPADTMLLSGRDHVEKDGADACLEGFAEEIWDESKSVAIEHLFRAGSDLFRGGFDWKGSEMNLDPSDLLFGVVNGLVGKAASRLAEAVLKKLVIDDSPRECWKCHRHSPARVMSCVHVNCGAPFTHIRFSVLATLQRPPSPPRFNLTEGGELRALDDSLSVYKRCDTDSWWFDAPLGVVLELKKSSVDSAQRLWFEVNVPALDRRGYALAPSLSSHAVPSQLFDLLLAEAASR
jgi:hypothetical protein